MATHGPFGARTAGARAVSTRAACRAAGEHIGRGTSLVNCPNDVIVKCTDRTAFSSAKHLSPVCEYSLAFMLCGVPAPAGRYHDELVAQGAVDDLVGGFDDGSPTQTTAVGLTFARAADGTVAVTRSARAWRAAVGSFRTRRPSGCRRRRRGPCAHRGSCSTRVGSGVIVTSRYRAQGVLNK